MIYKLNTLSISTLCIRLNTLQYIQKQVDALEDGIRKSWALVRPSSNQPWSKETYSDITEGPDHGSTESVDELLAATFDSIKDTASGTIRKICAFTGARVVFWDLRDSFLFRIYCGSVEGARLDSVLPYFDSVLKKICDVIDKSLRDLLVSSICRSSMTNSVIQMLMTASEYISVGQDSSKDGTRRLDDAHTLLLVLCHKKDKEASSFLKRHCQLPASSEYDGGPVGDSDTRSPFVSDLLMRSASVRWPENGNSRFRLIKKKLTEATS